MNFEISFVGMMNISLYTFHKRPRIAPNETCEKRHGHCDIYSNPCTVGLKFLVGSATAVAGYSLQGVLKKWDQLISFLYLLYFSNSMNT